MYQPPALKPIPWCNVCNEQAFSSKTRFGERCTCRRCGRWSWDRKQLADKATHDARRRAHAAFDRIWNAEQRRLPPESGPGVVDVGPYGPVIPRGRAYVLLQRELGLSPDECHMAIMDVATALRVPHAVRRINEALRQEVAA